ncbi:hypothetical protein [Pseudocitrobacter vendiensis]|uniref:Uncharacterized protein n=1 Tax=Pseudocitrobacter vendiensis TaxID=2488306 RepID=A0ABM9FA81_9ENTR|nr:hypothetical protein [Pseudocitrobacter vendiensis]CAH6660021.1 hypothetical protein FBBNIHIM_12920 [Pseudocitrobacter vendiensis]
MQKFLVNGITLLYAGMLYGHAFAQHSPQPRSTITDFVQQCSDSGLITESKEHPRLYEKSCANALRSVIFPKSRETKNWPPEMLGMLNGENAYYVALSQAMDADFDGEQQYGGRVEMADFDTSEAGIYGAVPIFHPISRGRFLIQMWCNVSAYNEFSLFIDYDETHLPATAKLIPFAHESGEQRYCISARLVDTRNALIYVNLRQNGNGDGGYYARYQYNRQTLKPRLLEVIYKNAITSDAPYIFDDDHPLRKPHGPGWERLYPTQAQ